MANMIDVHGELMFTELSPPTARTASFNGSAVLISNLKGKLKVTQQVGTVSGTSPTLNGKIQTGDQSDGSDATDLSSATFTQVTSSNNTQSIEVDTQACKKYIRYVGTIGGTSPSFTMTVSFVGQKNVI